MKLLGAFGATMVCVGIGMQAFALFSESSLETVSFIGGGLFAHGVSALLAGK